MVRRFYWSDCTCIYLSTYGDRSTDSFYFEPVIECWFLTADVYKQSVGIVKYNVFAVLCHVQLIFPNV